MQGIIKKPVYEHYHYHHQQHAGLLHLIIMFASALLLNTIQTHGFGQSILVILSDSLLGMNTLPYNSCCPEFCPELTYYKNQITINCLILSVIAAGYTS